MNFSIRLTSRPTDFKVLVTKVTGRGSKLYLHEDREDGYESYLLEHDEDSIFLVFYNGELITWVYAGSKISGDQIDDDLRQKAEVLRKKIRKIWRI